MDLLKDWFKRTFSDPQVVLLALLLIGGALIVFGLGTMLWPVFASIVVAYLLEALVGRLQRWGMPRVLAVIIVFLAFLAVLFFLIFGLIPIVLETSLQAQIVIPMAASLAFGILFATVITLFLIPSLYMILDDFGKWWREAWNHVLPGRRKTAELPVVSREATRPRDV